MQSILHSVAIFLVVVLPEMVVIIVCSVFVQKNEKILFYTVTGFLISKLYTKKYTPQWLSG